MAIRPWQIAKTDTTIAEIGYVSHDITGDGVVTFNVPQEPVMVYVIGVTGGQPPPYGGDPYIPVNDENNPVKPLALMVPGTWKEKQPDGSWNIVVHYWNASGGIYIKGFALLTGEWTVESVG